jgi:hypothetical protein
MFSNPETVTKNHQLASFEKRGLLTKSHLFETTRYIPKQEEPVVGVMTGEFVARCITDTSYSVRYLGINPKYEHLIKPEELTTEQKLLETVDKQQEQIAALLEQVTALVAKKGKTKEVPQDVIPVIDPPQAEPVVQPEEVHQ